MAHSSANIGVQMNIPDFVKQLKKMGGFNSVMCQSLLRWADTANRAGLFSLMMARNTKVIISNTIDTGGKGPGSAKVNWESLATRYSDWKESQGFYKTKIWLLEGNVRKNIVIRRTNLGVDVGLDRRVSVPRISYGSRSGSSISLEEYASYMELGTRNMHARALFGPSFALAVSEGLPSMKDAVVASMLKTVKRFGVTKDTGRANTKNVDITDVHSAHSLGGFADECAEDIAAQMIRGETGHIANKDKKADTIYAKDSMYKAKVKAVSSDTISELDKAFSDPVLAAELKKLGFSKKDFL